MIDDLVRQERRPHSRPNNTQLINRYLATLSSDELLRQFWEVEDRNYRQPVLSPEEQVVVKHVERTHSRDELGRLIVLLLIVIESFCSQEIRDS